MISKKSNNQFIIKELGEEIWKDIPGYETLYQASSLGRIKSLEKYQKNHSKLQKRNEIILKQRKNHFGRFQVFLSKDGIQKTFYVSRLILFTFVGPCPLNMETCHNNGDKEDNRLINLRWDTKHNNQQDRIKHGTYQYGEKNPYVKLTKIKVLKIRELWNTKKYTQQILSIKFNVSRPHISLLVNNKSWKNI